MTERERWELRGPVHSCRLQRTWYSRQCGADACDTEERGDTSLLEFRADGALVRRSHHNPDGSECQRPDLTEFPISDYQN